MDMWNYSQITNRSKLQTDPLCRPLRRTTNHNRNPTWCNITNKN